MGKVAVTRSKLTARRHKVPLSRVGENHSKSLTSTDAGERFLTKWQGSFKIDPATLIDERTAAIAAKHLR
jgi:hypothetical protein